MKKEHISTVWIITTRFLRGERIIKEHKEEEDEE